MSKGIFYLGDALTKVGGGLFGGSVVALYFNGLVLSPNNKVPLLGTYTLLVGLGIFFFIVGYCLEEKNKE